MTVDVDTLAAHAIRYAENGLEVFPVNPADKTPLVSQYEATTINLQIDQWWTRWPNALIGHRLPPHHIILDVDPRHGGKDVWTALKAEVEMPNTRGHASGRGDGGGHLWWLRPDDKLSTRLLNEWARERGIGHDAGGERWTAGIDILQHTHRYTILPPSPHPDTGKPYRWLDGHGLEVTPAPLPVLIADLLSDVRPVEPPRPPGEPQADSIADWYSTTTPWTSLLPAHGWTLIAGDGNSDGSRWRHPTATSAFSATIRHGHLFVYSTSTAFEPTESGRPAGYSPFKAYATLEHHGDQSAAARTARQTKDGNNGHHDFARLRTIDPDNSPTDDTAPYVDPTLLIEDIVTVITRVDAAPAPRFLARPVWPGDAHGIIGAENKAGKTWAILDLAVTVASGKSWLGQYPCEQPGQVLVFLGEGGERKMVRRARAVAAHYHVQLEDLPIRICHRVPQLAIDSHIAAIRSELAEHPAVLVIVDPLYLAAKGAKGSQLFEMATVLEPIQVACQQASAALVVAHHWNKTGTGKDRDRFSGAGSAEWGRVLASVAVASKNTDSDGASNVVLEWQFIGDEIPDVTTKIRRRVRALDPNDLASPMHYEVELADIEPAEPPAWDGPTQCMEAVEHLVYELDTEITKNQIQRELRDRGNSYRKETIGQAAERLVAEGRLQVRMGPRSSRLFRVPEEVPDALML